MAVSQRVPRVLWQIIDVNANRAMEGIRAAEEFVRFGLRDVRLTRQCRHLRHGIGHSAAQLPGGFTARVAARDVQRDVGRRAAPRRSRAWAALLGDNLQRTKESLRVLEECARVIGSSHAARFQRLRFHAYALEAAIHRRLAAVRHLGRRRPARTGRRRSRAGGH